jgi:hypothetical protein
MGERRFKAFPGWFADPFGSLVVGGCLSDRLEAPVDINRAINLMKQRILGSISLACRSKDIETRIEIRCRCNPHSPPAIHPFYTYFGVFLRSPTSCK